VFIRIFPTLQKQ